MSKSSSTNEQGVAMVEFAIILPLLLFIFLGIAELGRALHFQHRLTYAVEAGARYAARATGAVDKSDCTPTAGWVAVESTTRQLVTYGQMAVAAKPLVPGLDVNDVDVNIALRSATGVPDPVCVVRVFASVKYQGLFGVQLIPLLNIDQPTLGATSEERYVGE